MSLELIDVLAGVAVLLGAMLQAAVGFGFSLVCAPLVFAAAGPLEAVGLLTILGFEVNLLSLVGERRRPQPLTRTVATILAWSVPGMFAGVAVLRSVSAAALQILLTVVVFVSLAVQQRASTSVRAAPEGPGVAPRAEVAVGPSVAPRWAPPAAGLAAGALVTTTSAAGPPLVLLLRNRGLEPIRVRDTLTMCFAGLALLAVAVLAITGTDGAVPHPAALAALVPLAAAGQLLGRPRFARLAAGRYELALTITITNRTLAL